MINLHKTLEKSIYLLTLGIFITILIGGVVEIVPLFLEKQQEIQHEGVRRYTPLELMGFNIYVREGCYGCHSQQIRQLVGDVKRYGHYSIAEESMYDYPFQWGSKRTGPDLARIGGKYSDAWHRDHLIRPKTLVPDSIMPGYPFLMEKISSKTLKEIPLHLETLQVIGVPYTDKDIAEAQKDISIQLGILKDDNDFAIRYDNPIIRNFDEGEDITEMDALIAYLQQIGTHIQFNK